MRESVRFDARQVVPGGDGAGNAMSTWSTFCGPVNARLQPVNGREEVLAGKLMGVQPFILTVRYSSQTAGVTTDHRAVNARTGDVYDITAISNPDERRAYLSMVVKRGVAAG